MANENPTDVDNKIDDEIIEDEMSDNILDSGADSETDEPGPEEEDVTSDSDGDDEVIGDDDEESESPEEMSDNIPDSDDEESSEVFDEDGNTVSEEDENAGPSEEEQDKEKNNEQTRDASGPDSEADYIARNINREYIPGTNEFFDAVDNDARKIIEDQLGEDFDEFNPKHMARYNYVFSQCARSREDEMKRGLAQCRQRDSQMAAMMERQKIQQGLNDFLNKSLPTDEMKQEFIRASKKITVEQQEAIDAQIAKGDYSGVQKLIEKISSLNGKIAQTKQTVSKQPAKSVNKAKRVPLASDLFM